MRDRRGVSLLELVIVMIIIIMVAGFAVYNGSDSIEKAEVTEVYAEISNIKSAVNGVIVRMDLEEKENDSTWLEKFYDEEVGSGWYEVYGIHKGNEYLSSEVRKNLGMDEIKRSYQINFATGEVKLSNAMTLFDRTVQTYDEIRELAQSDKI